MVLLRGELDGRRRLRLAGARGADRPGRGGGGGQHQDEARAAADPTKLDHHFLLESDDQVPAS